MKITRKTEPEVPLSNDDAITRYLKNPPPDVSAPVLEDTELKRRVDMLWRDHPHLWLEEKYGRELIEKNSVGETILPDHPDDIYQWPWRKVQQFSAVHMRRDPGEVENPVIRANLVGFITAWKRDRIFIAQKEPPVRREPVERVGVDAEPRRVEGPSASSPKIVKVTKPNQPTEEKS